MSGSLTLPSRPAAASLDRDFRERGFVPVLVYVGVMVSIISSLGAQLLPSIARSLHASLAGTQWALTATFLVGAVASPIVGRLGDGRHRKTVVLVCLGAVTVGGALAAVAGSLPVLVGGRALQGMGLALLPLTMAAARDRLRAHDAVRVIALLSVAGAAGAGLGYPITGLIADRLGVSAAFWFGSLSSGLAFVLCVVFLPPPRSAGRHRGLDLPGALMLGAGVLGLLLALEKGPAWGWASGDTLLLVAVAGILLAVWARHELRVAEPVVDLRLLRHRAVLTANVGGFLIGLTMTMAITLLMQFVQIPSHPGFGLGASVLGAGLSLVPLSIFSYLASGWTSRLERRFGMRPVIPLGSLIFGAGLLFFALTATSLWQAFVTMGVVGVSLGFTFAAMPGLIVSAIPASETGSAMGFYQVSRFIGFSVGSGLSVTFLRVFAHGGATSFAAYRSTLLVGVLFCVLIALVAWALPGSAPVRAPVPSGSGREPAAADEAVGPLGVGIAGR